MNQLSQGISPQDRQVLEELMATGAMNPSQAGNMPPMPEQAPQMPPGAGYGAAVQALQGAAPTGGMVPTNQHGPPPDMATPASNRVGLGEADLANAQFPSENELMQLLLRQQMIAGGDPNANANRMAPDRGRVAPGMEHAPAQAPLPEQLAMMRGR